MAPCAHTDLFEAYAHCVADTDRLNRLALELRDASRQFPSVLMLIGSSAKGEALRNIIPSHKPKRRRSIASVHVDPKTSLCVNPLLYIDCDIGAKPFDSRKVSRCHEMTSYKLQWQLSDAQKFRHLVFARLLFLITDVVCIFADDFAKFADVQTLLLSWVESGVASMLPVSVKPRIVVITGAELEPNLQLQEDCILEMSRVPAFRSTFSGIRMVKSGSAHLRSILVEEDVALSRLAKTAAGLLFSAKHLAWVYRHALRHFCQTIIEPFSHYQCFFAKDGIVQYDKHASVFMRLIKSVKDDPEVSDIHEYLASAVFLDMYPVGAFLPVALFDNVYKQIIGKICDDQADLALCVDQVRAQVVCYAGAHNSRKLAHRQHARNLVSLAGRLPWEKLKTNKSCLACLRRSPQHCLICKHALCDICVKAWGTPQKGQEYTYRLLRCPLCLIPTETIVILKPPTAGIRLISIDGGGVRGIVPLRFLNIVEQQLESELQQFFDIAFGTSSGGLVTLGLFAMKWTVPQCIAKFEDLARDVFNRRDTIGVLGRIRKGFSAIVNDAVYDVHHLEGILKTQFGRWSRLFDSALDGCSRYKIAVTATNITDSSPFVLSNYNGADMSAKRTGYEHVRAELPSDDPLIWQAARATTAAFSLFPVITLPIGTFQDGGSREHNNPTPLATWEARQIWPDETVFDVILSLGTGSAVSDPRNAPPQREGWKDGFLPRYIRSSLNAFDGEVQSRHTTNTVNTFNEDMRAGWFRLNINSHARLDDAGALTDLCKSVEQSKAAHELQIVGLGRALLASCFFFELDGLPDRDRDENIRCTGHIRLRGLPAAVQRGLSKLDPTSCRFFYNGHSLGELDWLSDVCRRCGRFGKKVSFTVYNIEEKITVALQVNNFEQKISGFPQTIAWFVKQQDLDSFHSPRRGRKPSCDCCLTLDGPATLVPQKRKLSVTALEDKRSRCTILRVAPLMGQSWL